MVNIKTIDWNDAWKEARAQCNFQIHDSTCWNKRAPGFAEISMKTGYAEAFLKIMNPKKNWSIFDMACGAGTLAIPFAGHVKSVTAVDFSDKMLEILQERCRQAGITNVRTIEASWEDNWNKAGIGRHDVAIASRSLVVDDLRHGITKLNNIARKRVYISTIVDDGPHDRRIYEAVGRELDPGPDYIYNYNLLYSMGIYANVNFIIEDNHKTYGSHAEAIDSVRWMLNNITSEEEKKLEDYFDRHLIFSAGRWMMDHRRTIRWAVIWWDKATNIK
jgi:SAM-dependent methyltransferase